MANSVSRAAKVLATTPSTLEARGKIFRSADQVPDELHPAMAMAVERAERVIVLKDGTWRPLTGDPATCLVSARQRAQQGSRNAQIGETRMEIHSVTCDAETWAHFLELGGSKWLRSAVKAAHKASGRRK
ncbi:hypothetical protein [Stutzerimonas stutzeri]|uniref:hypothetical protein n=1 Tax=Stutzerimonas stutzeri TaxID=316 RepID=UPI0015E44723|nr:hypothetical protein [Stutzerimonas stutzeri]MBA1280290.1 hypothetical protein [Stutzerimonas stutzeri]